MILEDLLQEYRYDPDYIYEGLKYDLSEQLKKLMKEKGLSKKELAERMKVSPSYITKIFGADNISLRTVAKVLAALEVEASLKIVDLNKSRNNLKKYTPQKKLEVKDDESDTLSLAG